MGLHANVTPLIWPQAAGRRSFAPLCILRLNLATGSGEAFVRPALYSSPLSPHCARRASACPIRPPQLPMLAMRAPPPNRREHPARTTPTISPPLYSAVQSRSAMPPRQLKTPEHIRCNAHQCSLTSKRHGSDELRRRSRRRCYRRQPSPICQQPPRAGITWRLRRRSSCAMQRWCVVRRRMLPEACAGRRRGWRPLRRNSHSPMG